MNQRVSEAEEAKKADQTDNVLYRARKNERVSIVEVDEVTMMKEQLSDNKMMV